MAEERRDNVINLKSFTRAPGALVAFVVVKILDALGLLEPDAPTEFTEYKPAAAPVGAIVGTPLELEEDVGSALNMGFFLVDNAGDWWRKKAGRLYYSSAQGEFQLWTDKATLAELVFAWKPFRIASPTLEQLTQFDHVSGVARG